MTSPNPQIELARRYVEQTGTSLFLTGKAGTGKTTFLHDIDLHCPKRHVVTAPTGVAAVNAGGVTLHSFFQLPPDPYLPDVKELVTEYQMPDRHNSFSKTKINIIRTLELLIIDEISMVRADLLDAVDMTLRRVRRSSRPFGGVQLLMIGDVHQLPPVVSERERPFMERVYPSPFFFHSKALGRLGYVTVELTTVYRQQNKEFVNLLNKVRNNELDETTLRHLNSRCGKPQEGAITLTTHNHQADQINQKCMEALDGESKMLKANVQGDFPESMYPVGVEMEIKVGERVMFVKNDTSGGHRYYNGKLATVVGFETDSESGRTSVVVNDDDGDLINVGREKWENIKYTLNAKTHLIEQEVAGSFIQYPLRPAWAVTIHKAQGLTFDRVNINASDAFAFGQVYVALSRCRSLEGLTLASPLTPSVSFSDADVQSFCDLQPTFEEVTQSLPQAEAQYYYEQLIEIFGADTLLKDIDRLAEVFVRLRPIYPRQYEALVKIQQQIADLVSVAEKFHLQLMRIPFVQHAERIAKGTAYYIGQLTACQQAAEALLDVEVDNKDIIRQLDELKAVFVEHLGVKLACLKAIEKKGFTVAAVQEAKTEYIVGQKTEGRSKKQRTRISALPKKTLVQDSESQDAKYDADVLMGRLLDWRRAKASELKVSPFMVLHQKTLAALASKMPMTEAELLSVPGIGRNKKERFGSELLELIVDYKCNS